MCPKQRLISSEFCLNGDDDGDGTLNAVPIRVGIWCEFGMKKLYIIVISNT